MLYRERIPSAKWRFTVWDGEGSFNNQSYYGQPPSWNIITNHLTGTDDTNELSTIWQRLAGVAPFTGTNTKGNAEFRLLVAVGDTRRGSTGRVGGSGFPAARAPSVAYATSSGGSPLGQSFALPG